MRNNTIQYDMIPDETRQDDTKYMRQLCSHFLDLSFYPVPQKLME